MKLSPEFSQAYSRPPPPAAGWVISATSTLAIVIGTQASSRLLSASAGNRPVVSAHSPAPHLPVARPETPYPMNNPLSSFLSRSSVWLETIILPVGWFTLLTGMFWIVDRSYYHKLYYLLLAFPAFVALALRPRCLADLLRNPLVIGFLVFSGYMLLSLLWSDTDNAVSGLVKRPLYVFLLFAACALMAQRSLDTLMKPLQLAALASTLAALGTLLWFFRCNQEQLLHDGLVVRLSGYGALYNALLTSHVYGFFAAWWLGRWLIDKRALPAVPAISLLLLAILLLATGSRTPLVGLGISLLWLTLITRSRKGILVMACLVVAILLVFHFHPDTLTQRGYSYRPQIWAEALRQFQESPWFGHGMEHAIRIKLDAFPNAFADPHNIQLAILICGGLTGWAMWVAMYGMALAYCIRERHCPLVRCISATIVFGLTAGMTEGGAYLSRPKEHWFLGWIPLAMLAGLWIARRTKAISARTEDVPVPVESSHSMPKAEVAPAAPVPAPCPGART